MKVDIIAFGAHPDDIELGCGGTIVKHIDLGFTIGAIDLTHGELGTRGSAEIRLKEAEASKKLMGLKFRENLGFEDGFVTADNKSYQLEIVKRIRKYQPDIVLCNAIDDRHPDHPRSASLVATACFLAGLTKIKTEFDGGVQSAFRTMRLIVLVGWAIYPLGYVFGYAGNQVDAASLNAIYNIADFVNKIAFGLMIWAAATSSSEKTA